MEIEKTSKYCFLNTVTKWLFLMIKTSILFFSNQSKNIINTQQFNIVYQWLRLRLLFLELVPFGASAYGDAKAYEFNGSC